MKITTEDVSGIPSYDLQTTPPWEWPGTRALDGTIAPWKNAPVMSRYLDVTNKRMYMKVADTDATADWSIVVHSQGDFTISGTLTAGDVVITS